MNGLPDDLSAAFRTGFDRIRTEFEVPGEFPADVLAEAERVASSVLGDLYQDVEGVRPDDRTDVDFVTLDPATSTDLDQAFAIEVDGDDVVLSYAIADVARFVVPGGLIDAEAWRRGVTIYLPDGRASLHPPRLADDAASLLPDVERPAVVFTVRVDPAGGVRLDAARRSVIRSRAKLGYSTVTLGDLPAGFEEFAQRIERAEIERDAERVEAPEQEVVRSDDGFELRFRPRSDIEEQSAALSLATNMAVADALYAARTGLFRTMEGVDETHSGRLRNTARAFGFEWPSKQPLSDFLRSLPADDPRTGAFQLAVRRAGGGARYEPYTDGVVPWHAAVAATYSHATAPLRRLADRFVIEATLRVVNGAPVPEWITVAFQDVPEVMRRADALANRVDRAALDVSEAVVLSGREGQLFDAVVTDEDERGVRIQIGDPAIVSRVTARSVDPGDPVRVRLTGADPVARAVTFERVS